jgi:uncharacterized protein DUF4412
MTRTLVIAVLLALSQHASQPAPSTPAGGVSLSAAIRLSIAKVDVAQEDAKSPYGNFGPLIAQLLTPDGPVDIHYVIAADQSRAEVDGRLAALPRGTVVLQRAREDSIRVLNPTNKTWYEIPAAQNPGSVLGVPDVDMQPTGETATIAGQRAQRFRFNETLRVPPPEGVNLPPEFPSDLRLSGDLWTTDAFSGSNYAAVFRTLQTFAAIPGIEALTSGGRFPLRLALRSNVMPGYEIRSEVTKVTVESADPSSFIVPAGYQKVVAPAGR